MDGYLYHVLTPWKANVEAWQLEVNNVAGASELYVRQARTDDVNGNDHRGIMEPRALWGP